MTRVRPALCALALALLLPALACHVPLAPAGAVDRPEPAAREPLPRTPRAAAGTFAENPIVYFVITDRFYNGNPDNDRSYGRQPDGEQEIGTFHGGDLAGLTRKLEDGYFRDLGVNGLWITAPYEQIHGWVVGGEREFKHYAYHGYYALDYTVLDQNMGTAAELRAFIDTAHGQDIRVIFDIVMNHPGYADIQSLVTHGVDVVWSGWEAATPRDYHSYIDYNSFHFTDWWGPDWVRAGLPGYEDGHPYDERRKQLAYLPDFKTESEEPVALPVFLAQKPGTRARTIAGFTVRDYLITWLTDWVREYGVDGFRCDTAKHVELEAWAALKAAGVRALAEWKQNHPDKAMNDEPFWMTGEVFPHGVERSAYFDHGFDSIINFDLQEAAQRLVSADELDTRALDALYADYAGAITSDPGFNVLSYLSSHDTALFPRDRLIAGGTILMLAPGGVQIFYGDESARPPGPVPKTDPLQATRSSMNWDTIDHEILAHWQTLGRFRRRHVALAAGQHRRLADQPYTFARLHPEDRVVVALGAMGTARIAVDDVFPDGTTLRDAYGGDEAVVMNGEVTLRTGNSGVVLLEALH